MSASDFARGVEVSKWTPHGRVQQRTVEHSVDVPVPQNWQNIVEVVRLLPREREQQINEQFVAVPVSPTLGYVSDEAEDADAGGYWRD